MVPEAKNLELVKNVMNNGRSVAREAAVMPIPGSIVDQITTPVVEKRKSDWTRVEMYLRRMIEAIEPLMKVM